MHHYRQALLRMRQGDSDRDIAKNGLMGRRTAANLRLLASERDWLSSEQPAPDDATIAEALAPSKRAATTISSLEPHRERIAGWLAQGVSGVFIHTVLKREYGFTGHYSAVRRMLDRLKQDIPPKATVRLNFAPGEAAQVDFGAGPTLEHPAGGQRRTWAFVMTLCFSRHQYVEFVWDQTVATWLGCHRRAFEWFAAVPARVIIDNAKCAIIKACLRDPEVQRSYADCAEGYGFKIDPCPPHDPQKKASVSYCTLFGSWKSHKNWRCGAVSSALAFDERHVTQGFVEATVLVAIAMLAQVSFVPPMIDRRRADAQLCRQLVGAEHSTRSKALEAALQVIGIANGEDLLQRERLATPVLVPQRIEALGNFLVRA